MCFSKLERQKYFYHSFPLLLSSFRTHNPPHHPSAIRKTVDLFVVLMSFKRFLCSCVILKREHHFILLDRRQSPPDRFSVMKQSDEHFRCFFFFCATKNQSETCEMVEDARWSVLVSPFDFISSVQAIYRLQPFKQMDGVHKLC